MFAEKTALLQTLVVSRLVRFANVLSCALAAHYLIFFLVVNFQCFSVFLHLAVTVAVWPVRECGRFPIKLHKMLKRATTFRIPLKPLLAIPRVCALHELQRTLVVRSGKRLKIQIYFSEALQQV